MDNFFFVKKKNSGRVEIIFGTFFFFLNYFSVKVFARSFNECILCLH